MTLYPILVLVLLSAFVQSQVPKPIGENCGEIYKLEEESEGCKTCKLDSYYIKEILPSESQKR